MQRRSSGDLRDRRRSSQDSAGRARDSGRERKSRGFAEHADAMTDGMADADVEAKLEEHALFPSDVELASPW